VNIGEGNRRLAGAVLPPPGGRFWRDQCGASEHRGLPLDTTWRASMLPGVDSDAS